MRRFLRSVVLALCLGASTAQASPERIVDGWYAHNATLIMLGAGGNIIGTVISPKRFPWMACVAPTLKQAGFFPSMTLNAEAVFALHPDLVFVTKQSNSAEMLGRLGLNVETVEFSDFKGLIGTIDQTAALLGTDLAKTQAEHYGKAFSALDERQPVAAHPPRILHIASFAPLTVDGEGTIIDEWIRDAGGLNAATGLHGNKRPVSLEQILSWAPDLIILGADAGEPDPAQGSGLWSRLAAVQHGRVFRNPAGVFNWDRYSPELLLQRIWARDLVRTGSVDRPQMIKKIRDFYRDFYRHPIDQDDAVRILNAKPPLPEKCSGVTDEVGK